MNKLFVAIALLFFSIASFSQISPDKYYVQFTDKNNSPYSINAPEDYLSQRSIERRQVQNISIDIKDLPVNPQYLEGIIKAGAEIINPTKWLNGTTIYTSDPSVIAAIEALPYVQGTVKSVSVPANENIDNPTLSIDKLSFNEQETSDLKDISSSNYGPALPQIQQVNGVQMHENGYRGKGIIIGVLDSGFDGVDELPIFDSLWDSGRMLGGYDFVEKSELIFSWHDHGTGVFSIIAANLPGTMIGTAPDASYLLMRTEDVFTEFIIEEYNWISGAEFADSAGADILTTSLGYSLFNDPSQDHTYEDLDGNTTPITIGADVAASRGMAVVNSAGNSGQQPWYYITPPADGDSVFTIGGVDIMGQPYIDCGHGPTFDGRLKPNVSARAVQTYYAKPNGTFSNGNGTSLSSPIITGMLACLWQANPGLKNTELYNAVEVSSSLSPDHDDQMGYGIPDFVAANNYLSVAENDIEELLRGIHAYPNPFTNSLNLEFKAEKAVPLQLVLADITGRILVDKAVNVSIGTNKIVIGEASQLASGIYFLRLQSGKAVLNSKIVKQ